jgi:iron complex outermembrane receptor protein
MNNKLSLLWQSDYTRAYNTDNNQALPRISPLRLGLGLAYEYDKWLAKIKATYNAKQNKIPSNDIPSPSYTDLSLHIQKAFSTKYGYVTLFMRGDNLLNQDIRPASDFLRNVAPYGKRSIKLGMNIDF